MISMWKQKAALAVLGVALVAWGCDTATEPAATPLREIEASASNLIGGLIGDADLDESLEFVQTTSSRLVEQVVTALIGPDGGSLSLLGHELVIPAGAVEKPTHFVMVVLPGKAVQVELFAIDAETGLNVGEKGFAIPVQLALSYAEVNGIQDPSELVIVHITHDGERERLETEVDTGAEKARADLEHFSKYALCRN